MDYVSDDDINYSDEDMSDYGEEEDIGDIDPTSGAIIIDETEQIKISQQPTVIEPYNDIVKKSVLTIDDNGMPDVYHQADPIMTKFEFARLKGERLQQLKSGSPPFVLVPPYVTSMEEIFDLEFSNKRLPFIIKRGLPGGVNEYWKVKDLIYTPFMKKDF